MRPSLSPKRPAVAILFLAASAIAQAQPFPEPRVVHINERIHVLLGPIQHANPSNQGYMINSTVIVGDKGVILVDSGSSLDVGGHIARAVRGITEKPVTLVVNTHHHGDHILGNGAFPEATIVSSAKCHERVLETGAEWLRMMEHDIGHALPGTKPVAATQTHGASAKAETIIQGVRLVFWVPRGSHTIGDLMVYLPDDKVLIAGDVLVNGIVPTLQDGYLGNWIGTLDEIETLGDIRFVPGHGDLMTRRDVAALRDALRRFRDGVKQGLKRGESEMEVRKSLDLSAWQKLERAYVIGRNVNRAYLELERESFDD